VSCWVDCDRAAVSKRYDCLAGLLPVFDRLLFLPADLRAKGVQALKLRHGDCLVDVGCGPGINFRALRGAVGPTGQILGVDISRRMLGKAEKQCRANRWHNVELHECDAADFLAPMPLDAVLFSLSYNTMPNHREVLRNVWRQLRPGGIIVIVDARLPPGIFGRLILPFAIWLMKHTMLGNPLIRPWDELAELTTAIQTTSHRLGSYYISCGVKPVLVQSESRNTRVSL
jgi:ubiquinone/menaquinone biosynthesis C-methylase UbiE